MTPTAELLALPKEYGRATASRARIAGRYGVLKIVPDYPSPGRWVHAFKGTDGSTLDRVEMRCH
jgi:hypothetical protein